MVDHKKWEELKSAAKKVGVWTDLQNLVDKGLVELSDEEIMDEIELPWW